MSVFDITTRDLAAALLGKARKEQDVRVICSVHSGSPFGARYIVLVEGEYYEVGERVLDELRRGVTPAELELEPHDPEEDGEDAGVPSPDGLRRWHHNRAFSRAATIESMRKSNGHCDDCGLRKPKCTPKRRRYYRQGQNRKLQLSLR